MISPAIWREKLISKLMEAYLKDNRSEAIADLQRLIANKDYLENVLNENRQRAIEGWPIPKESSIFHEYP